jgi:hypothetical protein
MFFPDLISAPFHHGITIMFAVSAGLVFIAAAASLARRQRRVKTEKEPQREEPAGERAELVAALWPDED